MEKNQSTIILLDSNNLSYLEKIKLTNQKIITLDFESHKFLNEKRILHEISEDFIGETEWTQLQLDSFRFARWFEDETIKNFLEHDGINLGELFFVEFHYFLVPFLKQLNEILKIYNNYPNSYFICSYMAGNIIKNFTDSVEIINSKRKEEKFLYDKLNYSIKLKNKTLKINLSKKYYVYIKNFSEIFVNLFFGFHKISNSKKNIVVVEFDPIKYKNFFLQIPKFPINVMFYGRRRPAIWNKNSFSIIKNSNCFVITQNRLINKNLKNSFKNSIPFFHSKIENLWEKEDFFKSYFSLSGFSFWNIIKSSFMQLCKKRMTEAIYEIEITKNLFKKIKPSSILIWSENGFNEQIVLKLAPVFQTKIFLLQHGLYYDTKKSYEFNKFSGVLPIYSDKILVWGEVMKNYVKECGFLETKIEIIGSPSFDKLFFNNQSLENGKSNFILVVTSSPTQNIISDLSNTTRENYERFIENVCKIAKKLNKKLVFKLHPFQEDENKITNIARKIYPNTIVVKDGNIVSYIKKAEVVIVTDMSTAILEAQILQKPVLSVLIKDYGFGVSSIFSSNSCMTASLTDFETKLEKILTNSEFRKQLILNGNDFSKKYLANHGDASYALLSFLNKS